ncbi:MAG: glycosyltransferase [Rhodoferax sp.]|nr:glycosyltransferase [Rhodoferax sp.]
MPYLTSSAELVRMRNALLLIDHSTNDFDWTPASVPPSYMLERGPVDPFFLDVANRLGLAALPDDWARALVISRHLLGSSPVLKGGALKLDLRHTYQRIVTTGDGYCGDFVDVFMAIALAADMPVRSWAFSFDGFGGHGHIWPEIWNRQLGRWQLVGIFNNYYFFETPGVPLSALELRRAMLGNSKQLKMAPLYAGARVGMPIEEKAWDYYRRGLPEWYMWWGNNVFTYDRAPLVRTFSGVSRSLEQLGGVAEGVFPGVAILSEPGNQKQRDELERLRVRLQAAALTAVAALLALLLCAAAVMRLRKAAFRQAMNAANAARTAGPQIIVLTNLFPHAGTPGAGTFIRERMFRVGKVMPMVVVVPVPWFPLQGLIRLFRSHFRPPAPSFEISQGVPIFIPRFFSMPGLFRCWDGLFMALTCLPLMRRLKKHNPQSIIDAHFAYPAGYAAVLLGKWLNLPVTITMRGTEVSLAADPCRRARMLTAINQASRVFAVSDSLRQHAGVLGADPSRVRVIGNGVDLTRFYPEDRSAARKRFDIPESSPVLVSVGGLVERKGFHRVIAILPKLVEKYPGLRYLVVGGPSPEGDISAKLRQQVLDLKLQNVVHFLGALPPDEIRWPLSAADVFVLSTSNEGWANVFLEAMACGLPVITTNVGGNAEVVCRPELGTIVEFGNETDLLRALDESLARQWDRNLIIDYAKSNTWDCRVAVLIDEFRGLANHESVGQGRAEQSGNLHG